jgi:glyoxylase-like metal-dependent hydrolase (beta-lactamase superfamily II)
MTDFKQDFKPIVHTYTTPKYLIVNVYLIETEHGVVMVDGATALSTSREIRQIIDNQIKKPLLAVLLTHGHPDHYVGVGEIIRGLDVPIIATQGTVDFAHYQDREKFDALIRRNYGADSPDERVFPNRIASDNDVLTFDGVEFRLVDLGPCESGADSLWITTIDGVQHVFSGDIIYNHTHCYFRDGHALNWLRALDRLVDEFDLSTRLYPGHGQVCGTEMLYWQKAYITAFLDTLHTLSGGRDALDAAGKERLIARMRSFLPSEQNINLLMYELDETIHLLANAHEGEAVRFHERLEKTPFADGILLQRLGHGVNINAVHWDFQDGAVVDLHHHRQEQFGYVIKGAFAVIIGEETHTLRAGDSYFVPAYVPHKFVAVGETEAIDVFTPLREVGKAR